MSMLDSKGLTLTNARLVVSPLDCKLPTLTYSIEKGCCLKAKSGDFFMGRDCSEQLKNGCTDHIKDIKYSQIAFKQNYFIC